MPTFRYVFGYESPRQARNNELHGWDHEDSHELYIDAEDAPAALAWGHEVSEQFLKVLYHDPSVSWRSLRFASWVEPRSVLPTDCCVTVGELPDFEPWLRPYEEEER